MPIGVSLKNRRAGVSDTHVVIPSGNTVDRPTNPIFGSIRFNVDTARVEFWDGTTWRNLTIEGFTNVVPQEFICDGSTSIFGPMAQTVNNPQDILVFVGNVWQAPVDNYDIIGGTQLSLPYAPDTGIRIHILHNLNSNIAS